MDNLTKQIDDNIRNLTNQINDGFENMHNGMFNYSDFYNQLKVSQKVICETEDDREFEDYICPNCKVILQQRRKGATAVTIFKFKHCHECGQLLNWDGVVK